MPPFAKKKSVQFTDFQKTQVGFLCNPDNKGRYYHLRRLIDMAWKSSNIEWNPWLEDQLGSLCDDRYLHEIGNTMVRKVGWTGPGAAGKTFSSALYAMAWFLASPHNSSVTLTSTSKAAMGGRVWSVVQNLYSDGIDPDTDEPFDWHIINSRKILQWPRGDEKHNIACFAVEEGELLKSVDKIKGRHTERMLLIVDEANGTPEAIFNVIPNMLKGCSELVVLVFDNAGNMYGNHGRCCEPVNGWPSITVEDKEWETKEIPEWSLPRGLCKHYDGKYSPNVLAGKTVYRHIYSWENWQTALKLPPDSMHHWAQDRGFWAPEGVTSTVFSQPLIARCDATGFLPIHMSKEMFAFMDPGFGGDRCVAQFAEGGMMEDGRFGLNLLNPVYIEPRVNSEAERDYQIALMFKAECEKRDVKPNNAGTDATGIGRGVFAILCNLWSVELRRVEWGGKASEKPSSLVDGRPAHEIYGDRVTELWFSVKEFVEAGQLKGFYPEAVKQAVSREYEFISRRYLLNSKKECRKKLGYSPDEMDAISGLIEVVRVNGVKVDPIAKPGIMTSWSETIKEVSESLGLDDTAQVGPEERGGWADQWNVNINGEW